jgi:hypothetical protein
MSSKMVSVFPLAMQRQSKTQITSVSLQLHSAILTVRHAHLMLLTVCHVTRRVRGEMCWIKLLESALEMTRKSVMGRIVRGSLWIKQKRNAKCVMNCAEHAVNMKTFALLVLAISLETY